MTITPIADIIHEIDAYLSKLRQAREILLGRIAEDAQNRAPRSKRKLLVGPADPIISSRRGVEETKTRPDHPVADRMGAKEPSDPAAQLSSAVPHEIVDSEGPAVVKPEPERNVLVTRFPARRRNGSVKSVRHSITKSASAAKPEAPKPAIALAGPMSCKIVVVSAEQVQLERDQAALPVVRPPRLAGTGLTGRRAFEALFKDEAAPPAQ